MLVKKNFFLNKISFFSRSYFGRKNVFEQEQQIDYCQKKRKFDEELRDDLRSVLKDVGYGSGDDSDSDLDDDVKIISINLF
jgi:hypothetical protein